MRVFLLWLVNTFFALYSFAFIARAMLSWFQGGYYHPVGRFLVQITEPLLAPLRRYIPPTSGLDFTPLAALIILWLVEQVVRGLLIMILY